MSGAQVFRDAAANADRELNLAMACRLLSEAADRIASLEAENERQSLALARLNQLRRNITSTQSASWSNAMYPMVAILNAAGYSDPIRLDPEGGGMLNRQSESQREAHLNCYGGAGNFPKPEPDAFVCRPVESGDAG